MNIIAVSNHKGGVGKTTTSINVAAGLAKRGRSTLLIDLDPQGNATFGLGIKMDEATDETLTTATLFTERRVNIRDIIVDTLEPNLKLVPTNIRLAKAAKLLHLRPVKELILLRALEELKGFEFVIIDCQPSLEALTQNALVAADKILIPVEMGGFGLQGLGDLLETIEEVDEIKEGLDRSNPRRLATDWRIVLTKVSGYGEERNQAATRILEPIRDRVLKTQIRRNEAIEASQMASK
ncbi:MAG: AAA family ATPase, partial [Leptolyngbyaceae cyanobacterium CAN_BIN12]|nr:AAA family ATPase [Leptolyngbyaceae cyanobacterium CAN_BIN12]